MPQSNRVEFDDIPAADVIVIVVQHRHVGCGLPSTVSRADNRQIRCQSGDWGEIGRDGHMRTDLQSSRSAS